MDHPYYSVTITGLDQLDNDAQLWQLTAVEGIAPPASDRLVLADGFTHAWEWSDQQIPGQLAPTTVTFNLAARTAADLPDITEGQLVHVLVRVGAAGRVILDRHFRVAEHSADLRPTQKWAIRSTIVASDLSTVLHNRFPVPINEFGKVDAFWPEPHPFWSPRIRELAWSLYPLQPKDATSTYLPAPIPHPDNTAILRADAANWLDDEGYDRPLHWKSWGEASAAAILHGLLATHAPQYLHHAAAPPRWRTPPAGYSVPSVVTTSGHYPNVGPIHLPLVPAGRTFYPWVGGPYHLPYVLAPDGAGVWRRTMDPGAPADLARWPLVDAAWCILPAIARRSRATAPTAVVIGDPLGNTVERSIPSPTRRSRTVAAQLNHPANWADDPSPPTAAYLARLDAAHDGIAATFLAADPLADQVSWSYEAFTIRASLIPQPIADRLLPMLLPRSPGELDGDETLLRPVTLYGLSDNVDLTGPELNGFITAGTVTITDGELSFTVTTTPGTPHVHGSAGSIWWGGLPAGTLPRFSDLDPDLTWADTNLIRRD